ncbi:MAG: L,D-transpeptidase family protein [Clostridiales Family XIII bacterium]|jgi:lipoprotein-anchoring transpeptidase ErfK/SrfK|nr:L,D-transpeptidase family protein [Clostridiales Family XIII bacterium]
MTIATIKKSFKIAVIATLALAVAFVGAYISAQPGLSASGDGALIAYADATDGVPVDISAAEIAPIKDHSYDGEKRKPAVKVTLNGASLKKDRDFKVSYENNKNPGVATVTITGKNGYVGVKQTTFNIIVQPPTEFKLKSDSDSLNASWKKSRGKVSGYKVEYAEDEGFDKSKIKELKSGTTKYSIDRSHAGRDYYVRVRAFAKISGETYYSEYTDVKSKQTGAASWFKKISDSITGNTKWIEADLSKQVVYLHKGDKVVKTYSASSGKPATPTIKGTFKVYKKIKLHDMRGDWNPKTKTWGYVTPNVKWATYFKTDYAFHGSYWNPEVNKPVDAKRTPRSHGCVNMREKDAKYLYNWASIGTIVVVHG